MNFCFVALKLAIKSMEKTDQFNRCLSYGFMINGEVRFVWWTVHVGEELNFMYVSSEFCSWFASEIGKAIYGSPSGKGGYLHNGRKEMETGSAAKNSCKRITPKVWWLFGETTASLMHTASWKDLLHNERQCVIIQTIVLFMSVFAYLELNKLCYILAAFVPNAFQLAAGW